MKPQKGKIHMSLEIREITEEKATEMGFVRWSKHSRKKEQQEGGKEGTTYWTTELPNCLGRNQ